MEQRVPETPGAPATIAIRAAAGEGDVAGLQRYLAGESPEKHRDRVWRQGRGSVAYLVAWHGARPVGHLLVRWAGPASEPMATALRDCPELEDFFVDPAYRGRRIGLGLLLEAERLALARGRSRLALGVGLTPEYDRARALYLRLGYRNAGFPTYYTGWWTPDGAGHRRWWEEACEYLVKSLS